MMILYTSCASRRISNLFATILFSKLGRRWELQSTATLARLGKPPWLLPMSRTKCCGVLFGEPRRTNIYTGEIVRVGLHHIECSINSFEGCSGAVVFLLDKKQPSSVLESDWGCAIAVHAGAHSRLDRNIAFKHADKPRPADSTGN